MSVENNTSTDTTDDTQPVAPSNENTQTQTPPKETKPPVDVDKLLAKVREDVKNQLYPEIDKEKKRRQEVEAQLADLRKQLDDKEYNSKSQEEKLKHHIDKFESTLDELAKTAADREKAILDKFNQAQVDAYKEKRLREVGDIVDEEFVNGNTVEEVEASIQKAVSMAEKLKAKLIPEVEAKVKAEHKVPTPQAPSVTQTVEDKVNPFSLSHEEWAKLGPQFKRKALEDLNRG